jgi:hypothetical protein
MAPEATDIRPLNFGYVFFHLIYFNDVEALMLFSAHLFKVSEGCDYGHLLHALNWGTFPIFIYTLYAMRLV